MAQDRLKLIRNEKQMIAYLGADTREGAERNVYKYTDCGAWIEFVEGGVKIGSIVEGCDFGTSIYPLWYPFEAGDYDERMKAIEAEADALWQWCNVPRDRNGRKNPNGKTDCERGLDPPDIDCDYRHLNPSGRSS